MMHPLLSTDDETYWKVFIWFETGVILFIIALGVLGMLLG